MTDKEKQEKISRIIELQSTITREIIGSRNGENSYRPAIGDKFQPFRDELQELREELKDYIHPKSHLKGSDPQKPDIEDLRDWKSKNLNDTESEED